MAMNLSLYYEPGTLTCLLITTDLSEYPRLTSQSNPMWWIQSFPRNPWCKDAITCCEKRVEKSSASEQRIQNSALSISLPIDETRQIFACQILSNKTLHVTRINQSQFSHVDWFRVRLSVTVASLRNSGKQDRKGPTSQCKRAIIIKTLLN